VTKKPGEADPPRAPESSVPELRVAYTPAGRETLDAITHELVPLPVRTVVARESSSPEITIREGVIERDTLAAIMEEAGATADADATPLVNAPAIARSTRASAPDSAPAAALALEIFEMVTYVVRGTDVTRLATESLRRSFVEEYLLARLPVRSMAEVDRIDVTPWTVQGTLVVRVWCHAKPRS
jgi:hypothetical protein